jgi:hypothetical protein
MVAALETDYTRAPLSDPERVMVEYVVKLTKDAKPIMIACERTALMTEQFCRSR